MKINRREFTIGAAASATVLAAPALAQTEPLRIGWLAALTGPSSAPAIGFNRGVLFATEAINAAGGVKGRKIEIVTRDTQGDPTKAVNATQELISSARVHAVWGPTNSGESLAVTPIMARSKMPNIHPCVVDSLIDPQKFPNAFRVSPSNTQWDDAVRGYTLNILKATKVAVIGDTTGYGVAAVKASSDGLKKDGAEVVYQANIDATQPDMTPDLLRARNAGAQAIVVWSTSTGMDARLFNTRAAMSWDVPFVGHPSMSSGDIAKLVEKPENWKKVYAVGYRSCSYDETGKLPAAERGTGRQAEGQGRSVGHAALVGCGRHRRDQSDRQGGGRNRLQRERRHHQILEQPQELPRLFRRVHLYRNEPQWLSGGRCRHVRRQLGERTAPSSSRPAIRADANRIGS